MTAVSCDQVREFIKNFASDKLKDQDRALPPDFSDETDLLLSGVIDSLGILELVTALGNLCGKEIDFESIDPDQITVVGPLCRFVSERSDPGACA
jgi:acyl carrier protein